MHSSHVIQQVNRLKKFLCVGLRMRRAARKGLKNLKKGNTMQPDKIRLGNDSGYVAGTLDGARFNGTPHKEEFAHVAQAPAAAAAPFDLSSCCSADEDDGYNYCTCVGFAQSLLLTCWVCVCDLVENIKGCFACLWYTQEESQVSTFINKWDKRVVPKEGEAG